MGCEGQKTPRRVQMHCRKGGWRRDHPDAVIVARPSKWGNPYAADEARGHNRAYVTELFREHLARPEQAHKRAAIRTELRGRDLACWCPIISHGGYVPCHADVLLSIANDIPMEEVIRENTRRAKGETL